MNFTNSILTIISMSSFSTASASTSALRGDMHRVLQDGECNNSNAPTSDSPVSDKLNSALSGYGLIFRDRFDTQVPCSWTKDSQCIDDDNRWNCNDQGDCGVAASYLHADIITPNQAYFLDGAGQYSPVVGYAVVDNWSMNGGNLKGFAYYPTDANSVDHRNWRETSGIPGQGCHDNQNFVCNSDDVCGTYDADAGYNCKCDYDNYWDSWGNMVAQSFFENTNPHHTGVSPDPNFVFDQKQPSYAGGDYSSCWVDEGDFASSNSMQVLVDAQNSLYQSRDLWWDSDDSPCSDGSESNYQGYNELTFDANADDPSQYPTYEALVVSLPTGFENICSLDKDTAQKIDDALLRYWNDGYGHSPVSIMSNLSNDGENYGKLFFTQTYMFESGNCIAIGDDGTENAYFYLQTDNYC